MSKPSAVPPVPSHTPMLISADEAAPFQPVSPSRVPQLNASLVMRIEPVSCGNCPDSGTRRVPLGARVPAGQRGCAVVTLTCCLPLPNGDIRYITPWNGGCCHAEYKPYVQRAH